MAADAFSPELREVIEWTDAWQDHAEDTITPRLLLIGDSIARDYYPFARDALAGMYRVDCFCTSRFADDPFFIEEMARYVRLCPYEVIHLNHGLHGQCYSDQAYGRALEGLIKTVLGARGRLIVAGSTPIGLKDDPDQPEPERTAQVLERNIIAIGLAEQYNLPYNDLYAAVIGKPGLKNVGDGSHFRPEGSRILAEAVTRFILNK